MALDPEFRRALDEIKLRASIESIVGETCDLKSKGRVLWACCPFHDERTPSFKVDPAQGTWHCFGACSTGGDVIGFVQQRGNMTFMEAVELLAAQFGVELPRRKPRRTTANDPGLQALDFAASFFRKELGTQEGRVAREYLESRGFDINAWDAFGLGWAPSSGHRFLAAAQKERIPPKALIDAGLARERDRGGLYSFFWGRLMIPIRDDRGQTIGFGGRVVGDADGPKYVNTSETTYFHKGRVIYALDRAIESVRKGGHLVLVEGYTDVIAAHVAGMPNVGAVLGTATTEMHAGLVRRAGTKRVSLVFDGDDAGRRAAWRGLEGLLPHDLQLEVVPLPEGKDPADILMGDGGVSAFSAFVETGISWLDFVTECVADKRSEGGRALALEVDRGLGLIRLLPRPVEVDAAVAQLGQRLDIPLDTLRAQLRSLPPSAGARREQVQARGSRPDDAPNQRRDPGPMGRNPRAGSPDSQFRSRSENNVSAKEKGAKAGLDRAGERAYESIVAAALVDAGMIPRLRPWVARCPIPELQSILQTQLDLWENEDGEITPLALMSALGADPAAQHVVRLTELGKTADDPARLFQGAVEFLEQREQQEAIQRLQREIQALEHRVASQAALDGTADPHGTAAQELDDALMRLLELRRDR